MLTCNSSFSSRCRSATRRAKRQAVIRIRALKDQIDERASAAHDSGISNAATALKTNLSQVEEDLYQVRNRSPRDTLNYPIKLNNQLAVMQHLVDMGDARPTDQDYEVFKELSAHLAQIISRLDQILGTDVKSFNDQLLVRGLALVK